MKKFGFFSLTFLLVAVLAGCGLLSQPEPTPTPIPPTPSPVVLPTEIPLPTEAATQIIPTATLEATPTPAPITMVSAAVAFDSLQLRSGPGRLFERINIYAEGEIVTLIGREKGNNWVLVQTGDHRSGWMKVEGLTFMGSIDSLPEFKVEDAQILRGHVYAPDNTPATYIGVSLASEETGLETALDENMTNELGEWFLYLPLEVKGTWIVGPNSALCAKSNMVKTTAEGCEINGNLPSPQAVTLPLDLDLAIEFQIIPKNP